MIIDKETITGQIIGKANNYRAVVNRKTKRIAIIKDKSVTAYERSFLAQCSIYKDRLISKPFILNVTVFCNTVRYDLDNSLKTLLDCLQQARAITNDSLCYGINAVKCIDKENPRVTFSIEVYTGQ